MQEVRRQSKKQRLERDPSPYSITGPPRETIELNNQIKRLTDCNEKLTAELEKSKAVIANLNCDLDEADYHRKQASEKFKRLESRLQKHDQAFNKIATMTEQMTSTKERLIHPNDLLTQISPIFESIGKRELLTLRPAPARREQLSLSHAEIQQMR